MFELSLRQKIPQENIHNGLKQCCQSYGDYFSSEASMYSICTHGSSESGLGTFEQKTSA
jgi:hypothetical protein